MTVEVVQPNLNSEKIHSLLKKYPTSLLPKTSFSLNSEASLGNRILRENTMKNYLLILIYQNHGW